VKSKNVKVQNYPPSKDELEGGSTLSEDEKCYIGEVLDTKDSELIAARIDELDDSQPPRAIDSNKEIIGVVGGWERKH
jgi:hypothetical protein